MTINFIKKTKKISNIRFSKILGTNPSFITSLTKGERRLNKNHIDKIFNAIEFSENEKEDILLNFYLQDAPFDFKEKILKKLRNH